MLDRKTTIFIAGGGHGFGRKAALLLCGPQSNVIVADRNAADASGVADEIRSKGFEASSAVFSDRASILETVHAAAQRYGSLDRMLVSTLTEEPGDFLTVSPEDWTRVLEDNIDTTLWFCQAAAAEMADRPENGPSRSILLDASSCADTQDGDDVMTTASGWAIHGFMRSAALNLAPRNILVNAVSGTEQNEDEAAELAKALFSGEMDNVTGMTFQINDGASML